MLVRVKKESGNYGHFHNGVLLPRNWGSGAFEVPDAKGRELVARGVVAEEAVRRCRSARVSRSKLQPALES